MMLKIKLKNRLKLATSIVAVAIGFLTTTAKADPPNWQNTYRCADSKGQTLTLLVTESENTSKTLTVVHPDGSRLISTATDETPAVSIGDSDH